MARSSRPSSVQLTAVAVGASVAVGSAWVFARVDGVGSASAAADVYRIARRDARTLLLSDGALVAVLGSLVAVVAVAVVAWDRERRRSRLSVQEEPVQRSAGWERMPLAEVVRAGVAAGPSGLLAASVALLGVAFGTAGTLESIVGDGPSVHRSLLTFGGFALAFGAARAPTVGGDGATSRRAWLLLLAALPLYGVVLVQGVSGGSGLTLRDAVQRIDARFPLADLSPGVQDYYGDLYGPAYGADETRFTASGELVVLIILRREGGYDRSDEARLRSIVEGHLGPASTVVVEEGIAVVAAVFGSGPVDPSIEAGLRAALASD